MRSDQDVTGLVLAAGTGRRLDGRPKALLRLADGTTLVERAVAALRDGGCPDVAVVVGAQADAVADVCPPGVRVVRAADWAEGMGASLRAGLGALDSAALVLLVDMPGVGAEAVHRVLSLHTGPGTLAAATYDGRRGHPVLIGADHREAAAASAHGDVGARAYLAEHAAILRLVECGDVAEPDDIDTLGDWSRWAR